MFKIGFHTAGSGGNPTGLGRFLSAAGRNPHATQVVVCADGNTGFLDTNPASSVLLYRRTEIPDGVGGTMPDYPNMDNDPVVEAASYWERYKEAMHKGFSKDHVWVQTINEPNRSVQSADWLGKFSLAQAKLVNADGYKYMAFGYSTGTPDEGAWETDGMLDYLRYCAENQENAGVCLHEYSLDPKSIQTGHPHLVGRFKQLFDTCDRHGIARPKVIIGEAGWAHDSVPESPLGLDDLKWLADVYAPYDDVLGAALWWLGPKFDGIANRLQPYTESMIPLAESYVFRGEPNTAPAVDTSGGGGGGGGDSGGAPSIINADFGGGYVDATDDSMFFAQHIPNGWNLNASGTPVAPECTVYADTAYRLVGAGPFKATLSQIVRGLNPDGFYRLQANVTTNTGKGGIGEIELVLGDGRIVVAGDNSNTPSVIGKPDVNGDLPIEVTFISKAEKPIAFVVPDVSLTQTTDPETHDGYPRLQYHRKVWVSHPAMTAAQMVKLSEMAADDGVTLTQSFDDAGIGNFAQKSVVCWNVPDNDQSDLIQWFEDYYPGTAVSFRHTDNEVPLAITDIVDELPKHPTLTYRNRAVSAITAIAVHHTVSPPDRAISSLASYHVNTHGWPGIGYHFVINGSGQIFQTNRLTTVSYQTAYNNDYTVGIALQGNFQEEIPPVSQLEALDRLVNYLRSFLHITVVQGHREFPRTATACPGNTFKEWLPDIATSDEPNEGDARTPYKRETWVCPSHYTNDQRRELYGLATKTSKTITMSYDDAGVGVGLSKKKAVLYGVGEQKSEFEKWYQTYYPDTEVSFAELDTQSSLPPAPPPIANPGYVNFGIHLSADSYNMAGDLDGVVALHPDTIKVLSSHNEVDLRKLSAQVQPSTWIIRAFLNFGTNNVTPQQFVTWTVNDVRRTLSAISGSASNTWLELHNEPNLTTEGLGYSWANGAEFGKWMSEVATLYRAAIPGIKLLSPGLSPGGDISGLRIGHVAFWNGMAPYIRFVDGVGVHSYWSVPNYPMSTAVDLVKWYASKTGKPLYITEFSNNTRQTSEEVKAAEYIEFLKAASATPNFGGGTAFVLSASNPAWGWQSGSGEVITSKMIEIIKQR